MMTKKIILKGKTLKSNIFYFLGLSFIDINNDSIYTIKSSQIDDDITKASGTLSNNIEFTITSSSTLLGRIENVLSLNNTKLNKWNAENSWDSQNLPDSYVEIVFNKSINLKYICIMLWNQSSEYNIRDYFIYECYDDTDTLIGGGFLGNLDITKIEPFDTVSNTVEKLYLKIMPLGKLIKENISYNFDTKTKQIQEGDFGLLPLLLPDLTGYEKLITKDKIQVQKPIEISYPYKLITIKDIPFNTELFDWAIPLFTPQTTKYRFLIKFNDEDKYYYFKSNTVIEEYNGEEYSTLPAYTGSATALFRTALGDIKHIKEIKKLTIDYCILDNTQTFTDITFNIVKTLILNDVRERNNITIEKDENKLIITPSLLSPTIIVNWYEEKIEDFPDTKFMEKIIDLSRLNLSDKFIYDSESKSVKLNTKQIESTPNETATEYEINLYELGNWEVLKDAEN